MPNIISTLRTELQEHYSQREATSIILLVLDELFGISQTDIYMGKDIHLSEDDEQKLKNIIVRLCNSEPVQYILGKARFYGEDFLVTPDVLIPRPETEELIERILSQCPAPPARVLDIGSGSGCIPITLARHWKESHIESWDISRQALEVAQSNNRKHGTHVHFILHDILCPIDWSSIPTEGFDLIVSNPPYIKNGERASMEHNVLDWEPHLALFVPDEDPLLFYRTIVEQAIGGLLKKGGRLYFEINREHGKETIELITSKGFRQVELYPDISGNDRIVTATL